MAFYESSGGTQLESLGPVALESLKVGHDKPKKRLVAVAILADMERSGRTLAVVIKDYTYMHAIGVTDVNVTVPQGFVTDFASIPKEFQWLIHPFGSHAPAAVLHDFLYAIGQKGVRRYADALFLHAMRESGVRRWRRRTMYVMVRVFGGRGYGRSGDWAFADAETGAEIPEEGRPAKTDWAEALLAAKKQKKAKRGRADNGRAPAA